MRGNTITMTVVEKRGKAAKTIPLYQYDYGQKLLIEGVELPEYYEVHFSNEMNGTSVTVLGDSTGVLIPDDMVKTGDPIYVWLYLHDTSYDGETEYFGVIPIIKRAEPTDITPTPEEQSLITQAIAALNNMEDDMSAQIQEAKAAKEAAQVAQTGAETAANTASGYVDTVTAAETSAQAAMAGAVAAQTAAETAATSATASANSANNALADANNAKIAAVNAADAASTSATTASTASGNASNYATSAESAKVDAVAAATAAETAQGKAEDAQAAAETAQAAAEAAASSIENVIDDTAGEGDTNKTWSADKLAEETGLLLNAIDGIRTATLSDVGKALSPKTVSNGKVTEWQFVEGGGGSVDPSVVEQKVDEWLEENISNPDSPPLDRSLSSGSAAAPADIMGELMEHESYTEENDSSEQEEYEPVTPSESVASMRMRINTYNNAVTSTPTVTTMKIYPVVEGKTYKVVSYCSNEKDRPQLVVADDIVTTGGSTIANDGSFDYALGTGSSAGVEQAEYTALRTGYLYINSSDSDCGLWLKNTITPSERKYYIDNVKKDIEVIKTDVSLLNSEVFKTKSDSASVLVKRVPKNAETVAKVTSLSDSVTTVRSILGRNIADKNAVGDVIVDSNETTKKGIRTIKVPPGRYYISLGNMGSYTMVKVYEKGLYSTELYKSQFPMTYSIVDPAGGNFIVYASSIANLGDMSTLIIAELDGAETSVSFEAYSEKTYSLEDIAADNRITVRPNGLIEFANSSEANLASTVEYIVSGKDDKTTTRKDFITSPDGSKFLPMVKNDGTIACARVVPKKALFIGNSLTSGWQTFGEAATDSDHDFVAYFSSVVEDMESNYTFNRKWSTGFEQQTSLANAQSWVTTNIDPLLSDDLDLIVVQLCENVVDNASAVATFPESSLWLMKHLRTECPKARVVWMGVWFIRKWATTLLENTAKAGCEYIDIHPLYKQENVSVIGSIYKMDSDFAKSYDVDSFTVDNGQITLVFTVDGVEYTSTIPSYTSYTSSGDTQITVTGIYHVVNTWYAYMHPGNEGFRKIANKMLFDLGISDSEETIPADE